MLKGKNILLCVTGGIAVYKAAALTSKLTQAGASVKVIMSNGAQKFVTPLTFQALSRNDVYTDTFDEKHPESIAHIDLADWADLVLVAPATANIIGKLANGIADDMISTTLLAATAPVWIAPAMNVHMYDHPAVKRNIERLQSYGYQFVEPNEGYLACGYVGKGRMEEPENIVKLISSYWEKEKNQPLKGKKIVITAGPTREILDPVRFFSNRSSGKMGYALAEEAHQLGADVTLISGPVSLNPPIGVNVKYIENAEEMYDAVLEEFPSADIVIKSAAVADYRPKQVSNEKMKKQDGDLIIQMERTKDILKTLGERKDHQFLVGFAAETSNLDEYAMSKLKRKNADMIIANNVNEKGAGFEEDTNIVTIYKKDGSNKRLGLMSKKELAKEIFREIVKTLQEERSK
ncbi:MULTISPECIES: bifunctional phosphopantothenoylcysteine decarboxylase/phosphopantothenate--cysteine ligase CoaBC [Bacillus]|jgi:phosphopantothenoylcysteine decarboxylase/phosphopantothenate--cysteine ligase|uniref:bifunctional phosphopantothenoylcysteine decarboxylase/phosphopantothenate--cysteine ligase CoaBC n=1 Tax=Bacillus TaxID=1386 RepID=UPI00065DE9ED|nr:bifunctional phosphopantothenoylcysteine decarboxylase/phosphopantothenate--cysteine ligase CoaBC [Bacillus smithii]AKP46806.1 Phosphopantothenoylcysteine synthetase [Bacillus smithii]MED0660649.1 bifunctional phosphopantothenoylcysteine decarboxylase/phosphopantothenate--cysteine ligase CoaBC [Bacillus smithii]MED1419238.1 bifunctional phosphopantothenoylcysteine decarboxylase/phosphopantothenate--cysteine ligase CoaBC [Bacillus smithii]MED1456251.1 bifunctional phosphopantothenoylcysteine 